MNAVLVGLLMQLVQTLEAEIANIQASQVQVSPSISLSTSTIATTPPQLFGTITTSEQPQVFGSTQAPTMTIENAPTNQISLTISTSSTLENGRGYEVALNITNTDINPIDPNTQVAVTYTIGNSVVQEAFSGTLNVGQSPGLPYGAVEIEGNTWTYSGFPFAYTVSQQTSDPLIITVQVGAASSSITIR